MYVCFSAFDTLAKALNPSDAGAGQNLAEEGDCLDGATIQVISRDQVTPIMEVEGPLLTDTHIGFKVGLRSMNIIFTIAK